jgi:hypothetical protein
MNPTIQIPQLPPLKPDGTFDTPALQRFFQDMQTTLRDKQLTDYQSNVSLSSSIQPPHPVGTWYTQYPSVKSNDEAVAFPESEEPANKFGGVWTEPFAGEDVFFRTDGTLSEESRLNGLQPHAMKIHTHGMVVTVTGSTVSNSYLYRGSTASAFYQYTTGTGDSDNENRSKNRLVKVWYRES